MHSTGLVVSVMLAMGFCASAGNEGDKSIPFLRRQGQAVQLMVEGKPFLVLGGEVGNSAATELSYLEPVWPRLAQMHLNTVLVPVYWDQIEPQENQFDFSGVDGLLEKARAYHLRLILLWFGSWKNSMSCYAPAWVKTDWQRFPRARLKDGRPLEILSAFSEENRRADVRAFGALMRHLRRTDQPYQTVILMQVENEVGMLENAREWGPAANEAFAGPVPQELMEYLAAHKNSLHPGLYARWARRGFRQSGSWQEVFGKGPAAEEYFTAWHYGRYVQAAAAAGKAEYPLPMFVNAALNRADRKPGQYPSGGPLPHLMDIWKAAAPAVDFLSPDIYFPDFSFWCAQYHRPDNPLFIPENRKGPQCAAQVFYAVGQHEAIGFSPFAIDSIEETAAAALSKAYETLEGLSETLLARQGQSLTRGVLLDKQTPSEEIRMGGYILHVRHDYTWGWSGGDPKAASWPAAGGLILASGPDEFLIAGTGIIITFQSVQPKTQTGLLSIEEGFFREGEWRRIRRLSGDESHQGRHVRLPMGPVGVQHVRLYTYQ